MTAKALRSPEELLANGLVSERELPALRRVAARYAIAITPHVVSIMARNDRDDPIARQYLPSPNELITLVEERADPIGDQAHSPIEGVVHRYPDRVLLKLVNVCAVYCRFCFRREMVGPGKKALSDEAYQAALTYIRGKPEIWEVILTGGDPLMISPRRLRQVMRDLAAIGHVKIVRIHTRLPVADPGRVSRDLIAAMRVENVTTWLALHANHPREFTTEARAACGAIVDAGIPMVSQSVLLRGVNDDAATLEGLMRAFVECRIKPYYLHHGDLAPGTSHLRTSISDGQALIEALRGRVSGLCQPTYVLDLPGGHGKSPIGSAYVTTQPPGSPSAYRVRDYCGDVHLYPPEAIEQS